MRLAQGDQATGCVQHGGGIRLLTIHRQREVARIDGQPGLAGGEAGLGRVGPPRHRRAGPVAAQRLRPVGDRLGVLEPFERHLRLGQAQFFAVVDEDVAAQAHEQQHGHLGEGVRVAIPGPARDGARRVVVGEGPRRPALSLATVPGLGPLPHQLAFEARRVEVEEAVGAVQVIVAGGEGLHLALGVVAADLGHGEAAAVAVGQGADPLQEVGDGRVRLVVHLVLEVERPGPLAARRQGRIVPEIRVVHREVDGVEAEAVDAAVQPEARHLQQGVLHRRIVHVQLRLLGQEVVHVVLAAPRVPGPRRPAEHRLPVGRRRAVGPGVGPDVPVGLRIAARLAALTKPGVLVGGVGEHQVGDHLQPQPVGLLHEGAEVGQRAEDRIDVAVVGHVVAEVAHGRGVEGAEPDGVHAQRGDVLEVVGHALEVADAVAVRVGEAARIDLIDDRAAPPFGGVGPGGGMFENLGGHSEPSETQTR